VRIKIFYRFIKRVFFLSKSSHRP